MSSCGVCILCNVDVTDQDHRREVDCPSKTCPGRWYHEDCIAGYLKRTKYSKDRCTGFPCPAIMSTGKQCPGYVCKMHLYFPANQTKKKKKVEAAIAAAAAPKPRTPPVPKPKASAQVAIAAIKRAAPEGSLPPVAARIANTSEPRVVPGLHDLANREVLRAQVAKLKAEATASGNGGTKSGTNHTVRPAMQAALGNGGTMRLGYTKDYDAADKMPQGATVWDAITKSKGMVELNIFEMERNNQNGGVGQFTKLLRKRLEGDTSGIVFADSDGFTNDATGSETDSTDAMPTARFAEEYGVSDENTVAQQMPTSADFPALPPSAPAPALSEIDCADERTDLSLQVVSDIDEDPVVEYDMVYGAEDGSYLVLDAVSNVYYRLVDAYGESAQLVEVTGEDGNVYTCVAVRRSQLQARQQRQMSWAESQYDDLPQEQSVIPSLEQAAVVSPAQPYGAAETSCAMGALQDEEDGTDVESLMQLLCV